MVGGSSKASGKLAGRLTGVMVGHRPRVGRGEGQRREEEEKKQMKGRWGENGTRIGEKTKEHKVENFSLSKNCTDFQKSNELRCMIIGGATIIVNSGSIFISIVKRGSQM